MTFYQRKVFGELKNHLNKPEISLLLGPRQAGKTTIMFKLGEELKKQQQKSLYLNLDVVEDRQFFISQHQLVDKVQKTIGRKGVVMIDEIQRLDNAGLFLKGLFDLKTGYKWLVSGSGSLELKANIIEPMTGRKKVFYCLPLSWTEFAAAKLQISLDKIETRLIKDRFLSQRLRQEYFRFGGYPRVVMAETDAEKQTVLREIYSSYLEKDIQLLLGVEKEEAFGLLVKLLANQVGSLQNRANLAALTGVSEKTIEKYIFLLEKTFVIKSIKPFFKNARKEIRKAPKIYFYDLGFLHLAKGGWLTDERQTGGEFENACLLRVLEAATVAEVQYWRSSSGAEVDFVLVLTNGEIVPVEVKLNPGKRLGLGKSMISFIKEYRPGQVFYYTEKTEVEKKLYQSKIRFISYPRKVLCPNKK